MRFKEEGERLWRALWEKTFIAVAGSVLGLGAEGTVNNNRLKAAVLALLTMLGIGTAGGVYYAVDSTGGASNGSHIISIQALTWWSPCSQPPGRPNNLVQNLQADLAAGKQVAGYFLIAPPAAYGLPDTPANEVLAGKMSADRAKYGDPNTTADDIPDDLWNKLLFASGDTEVPGVCSPTYDVPIATIDAAMAEMATMKCLANVQDPCAQVNYTSWGEWLSHVKPYTDNPFPADTLLWWASWDGDPSFDSFNNHPFGGLTQDDVLLKQYQGDTLLNGQSVDLDSLVVDPRVFQGATDLPSPPTWDPVTARWVFPDGWTEDPAATNTGQWFDTGGNDWSVCRPWGGRDSVALQESLPAAAPYYSWKAGVWGQVPVC